MTRLIFIRHGQTKWNNLGRFQGRSDIELSETGLQQAEELANNFMVSDIDVVISSPLKRAYETAEILAKAYSVPLHIEEGFQEISFGLWEGKTYDEIYQNWPTEIEQMFSHPAELIIPEGETFLSVQERAMATIDRIRRQYEGKTVVIVAHGGILRTILAKFLHMPLDYIWTVRQDNTAVNIITYYGDSYNVELLNSTAHLQALAINKPNIYRGK